MRPYPKIKTEPHMALPVLLTEGKTWDIFFIQIVGEIYMQQDLEIVK